MLYYGENGIIRKAQQAKELHEQGIIAEQDAMNQLLEEYNNMMAEPPIEPEVPKTPAGTEVEKPAGWTSTKVTPIADGNGGTIPLPDDFYYIGGNYDTGIVISDKAEDTMDASGITSGNQFVWIPVSSEANFTRTEFDTTTGQPIAGLDTTRYTEPYAGGYSTEGSEYTTMHDQVLKYGGFYIGRYEAGVNSTTFRTVPTTEVQTVVSKKGVAPYNYVPWGKSMSDVDSDVPCDIYDENWNVIDTVNSKGAVYLAKNFASQEGYTSVESTLIYGSQWDAMCRYIGNANRTTQTKDAPRLTGSVPEGVIEDVSKNIYDLAGNCYEWTMEAEGTGSRVGRGGNYYDGNPVSFRSGTFFGAGDYDDQSFRCGLYVK